MKVFNFKIGGISAVVSAIEKLEAAVSKVGESFQRAGDSASHMAEETSKTAEATRKQQKEQEETNKSLVDFSKRLNIAIQKIITYRLAFGAFKEATRSFSDVIDLTIKMDDVLGDLKKVLFTSSENIKLLEREAFRLGKQFGRTGEEVASSFLVFAQQGLSIGEILDRTNASLLAVSSSTLTMEEAVNSLTAVVNNFDMDTAVNAVDKWAKVAASAPVTAKDLANAVLATGSAAKQAGITLDELNGVVAAVGEVTRKSGKNIGNAFKTILARIQRPIVIQQLKELGVNAFETSSKLKPMGVILRDLAKRWNHMSEVQQFNIAVASSGIRQYNNFIALMNNFRRFLDATTKSQNSFGFAQKTTLTEVQKFKRQIQSLKTGIQEFGVELGESGVLSSVIKFLSLLNKTITSMKGLGSVLLTMVTQLSIVNVAVIGLNFSIGLLKKGVLLFNKASFLSIGTLGSVLIAVNALVAAYTLFKGILTKSEREQKRFNESIQKVNTLMKAMQRQMIKNQDALEEFDKKANLSKLNIALNNTVRNLNDVQQKIKALQTQQGKLAGIKTKDLGGIIGGLSGFPTSVELSQLESQLAILERQRRQLEAGAESIRETIRQINGEKGIDVKKLRADKILEVQFAIEDVDAALKKLPADVDKINFRFEGLKDLKFNGKILEGIPKTTIRSREELDKLKEALKSLVTLLNVEKKRLLSPIDDLGKSIKEFRPEDFVSKSAAALRVVAKEIKNIDQTIAQRKSALSALNKPFDDIIERSRFLKKRFTEVNDIVKNAQLNFLKVAVRAELAGLKMDKLGEAVKKGRLDKLIGEGLKVPNTEAFQIAQKLVEKEKDRQDALKGSLVILKQINDQLKNNTNILTGRNKKSDEIKHKAQEEAAVLSKQQKLLNLVSSSLTGASRSRILESKILRQQIQIQTQGAILEFNRKKVLIEATFQQDLLNGLMIKEQAERKKNLALQKAEFDFSQRVFLIRLKTLENIIRENEALKSSITSAFASGLAVLPENIASRVQREKEIAKQRKELELEIQKAREQGDENAAQRARLQLQKLEIEAKRLGSLFGDVLNIFADVARTRFQKFTELIAQRVSDIRVGGKDIGETLSDNILQGSTAGALIIRDEIINAFIESKKILETANIGDLSQISSDELIKSIKSSELPDKIKKALDIGSRKTEQALQAGFQFGSILLGQLIGGGGPGAAKGSQLGGFFGDLAGVLLKLNPTTGSLLSFGATILGGLLGGRSDVQSPIIDNTNAIRSNTAELRNTNRLLSLQREFINAPSRFIAPPLRGDFGGGLNGGNINVSININGTSNPNDVVSQVVDGIDQAFSFSRLRSPSSPSTFKR